MMAAPSAVGSWFAVVLMLSTVGCSESTTRSRGNDADDGSPINYTEDIVVELSSGERLTASGSALISVTVGVNGDLDASFVLAAVGSNAQVWSLGFSLDVEAVLESGRQQVTLGGDGSADNVSLTNELSPPETWVTSTSGVANLTFTAGRVTGNA